MLIGLLPSSVLATWPTYLNPLNLITLTILGYRKNYKAPHFAAFSTPHSHPSWVQIIASRSCFQMSSACIPPLIKSTKRNIPTSYWEDNGCSNEIRCRLFYFIIESDSIILFLQNLRADSSIQTRKNDNIHTNISSK